MGEDNTLLKVVADHGVLIGNSWGEMWGMDYPTAAQMHKEMQAFLEMNKMLKATPSEGQLTFEFP